MASSGSLAPVEPWAFRATFPDSWISQMFAGENEALTKALQKSISNQSETILAPETPVTAVASANTAASKRRDTILMAKRTKRKSRASKKTTTTFIAADPANFRQMVQQVTGVRFGNGQMPAVPVLKPEAHRPVSHRMQGWLPTLDTSIPLLDRQQPPSVVGAMEPTLHIPPPSSVADGGGFNFASFSGFPTLESWKVL